MAVAPLPLLVLLPREFSGHADYAFAPFALVAAILIGRARVRRTAAIWPGNPTIGHAMVFTAGLMLLAAAVLVSPWAAAMALLLTAAAVAWEMGGWPALRALIPALLLLGLCVPLPLDLDHNAVLVMARWSGRWTSHLLDLLGVDHVRSEQVIVFAGGRLDLFGILGGPFSPIALTALLLGLAQAPGRSWWRTLVFVVTGLAFLPVVTAAMAGARIAWAGGAESDFVWAAAGTGLAAVLALSLDQWVGIPAVLALKPHAPPGETVPTEPAAPISGGGAVGVFSAAVFAALAVFQAWVIATPLAARPVMPDSWLPERIGDWVAEPKPAVEQIGVRRSFRNGDRRVELTVIPANEVGGGPLADFEASGWVARGTAVAEDDPTIVRAQLELPAAQFATICVCGLTADGHPAAPSTPLLGVGALARAALARPLSSDRAGPAWWVRVASVTILPPSAQEEAEPAEVVRRACEVLQSRLRLRASQ